MTVDNAQWLREEAYRTGNSRFMQCADDIDGGRETANLYAQESAKADLLRTQLRDERDAALFKLDAIRTKCETAQRHTDSEDDFRVGRHSLADEILDLLEPPK